MEGKIFLNWDLSWGKKKDVLEMTTVGTRRKDHKL